MTEAKAAERVHDNPTHLPGDAAMWVMVLGDLVIFGGYFIVYLVHRARAPQSFLAAQQHLDVTVGVLNTMVLLASSLLVARGVYAARDNRGDRAVRLLYAAGCCGVLFVFIKAYEWSTKIAAGYTVSNEFFSFYYVLTGVHLFHVALGLVILGVCVRELRITLRRRVSLVEQGATYWHMVDLLWIVIFGLLYVMR